MRKLILDNYNIAYPAQNLSLSSSFIGDWIEMKYKDYLGLIIQWTGTPVGTISILVSNDKINYEPLNFAPYGATPLTQIPLGGAAGDGAFAIEGLGFSWIAIQYISASGTGSLTGQLTIKTVGA